MKVDFKKPIFSAIVVICIFFVLATGFMHIKQIDENEKDKVTTAVTSTSVTSKSTTIPTTVSTTNVTTTTTETTTTEATTVSTAKETVKPTQATEKKETVTSKKTEATTANTQPTVAEKEENYTYNATFYLSDYERQVVESIVMGEAGAEPYDGQILVAQCLLNGCVKEGVQPSQLKSMYGYYGWHDSPSQSVKNAVSAVFDNGYKLTNEPILYFYAPAYCTSSWHESQRLVIEVGGHRFFASW